MRDEEEEGEGRNFRRRNKEITNKRSGNMKNKK